jgi:hypothetical protein
MGEGAGDRRRKRSGRNPPSTNKSHNEGDREMTDKAQTEIMLEQLKAIESFGAVVAGYTDTGIKLSSEQIKQRIEALDASLSMHNWYGDLTEEAEAAHETARRNLRVALIVVQEEEEEKAISERREREAKEKAKEVAAALDGCFIDTPEEQREYFAALPKASMNKDLVHDEIRDALIDNGCLGEEQAWAVVRAIAGYKIPHISINYGE